MAITRTQKTLYGQASQIATQIRADARTAGLPQPTWVEALTLANQVIFNAIVKDKE